MRPSLQAHRVDGIIMEAIPLGEMLRRMLLVRLAPLQHGWPEVDIRPGAVLPDGALGVVQHVVGVEHRQVVPVDDALGDEEVEQADELLVAGLAGREVVEARDLAQGRDRAAPVGRDGAARVADEEGEVELAEDAQGQCGRVVGVPVGGAVDAVGGAAEAVRESRLLAVGGEEVVGHVLDEDALTLGLYR